MRIEVGVHERAPGPLGDGMIFRLPVEFGHELGPIGRKRVKAAPLLGPSREPLRRR
jgi:hypothetical protein